MELLVIEHQDFQLSIECSRFESIWNKATNNVGWTDLYSTYAWSEGVKSVKKLDFAGDNETEIENGGKAPAIFFDNSDYSIWVVFNSNVSSGKFGFALQSDNDKFTFKKKLNAICGSINYGNDVGKAELNVLYKMNNGENKSFTFSFEVLSSKLNYHEHWRQIVEYIEKEYRMLSLDYLKRTFHGFSPDSDGENTDLAWWSIFASEQKKFINACKTIIERPRHRMRSQEIFIKAHKLKRLTPKIEEELAEFKKTPGHLYRVEDSFPSNDTQENRFLKFALTSIAEKYNKLQKRIKNNGGISDTFVKEMEDVSSSLTKLKRHPFFKSVGSFKGLNQESLILQKATGYSQIFRSWNLLKRAYSLNEGTYRLQTKDIATLYEIWCFIEVSHIVKEQLGLSDNDLDHQNRMEMSGLFTWNLKKGEQSKILFQKDGVELAELYYNPKQNDEEEGQMNINGLVSKTVPQKPDIVLQLVKNDIERDMKMTYLFDAKYRIKGTERHVDTPPDDAINQMHRYRDAIYYKNNEKGLKKEVIGGYILFPGDGEKQDIIMSNFYKSIDAVNIGAFPLRPKDQRNREILEDFIATLIRTDASTTVANVIPQKGAFVEVGNRVLIGIIKSDNKDYCNGFIDKTATFYYTGKKFPTTIALQDLHYFIPYIKGRGIRDIYEIVKVRTVTTQEAKKLKYVDDEDSNQLRIGFDLRYDRQLYDEYKKLNQLQMIDYAFLDTTFDQIDEYLADNANPPSSSSH